MKYVFTNTGAPKFKAPKSTPDFHKDLAEANQLENKLKEILEDYWEGCTITTSQDKGAFSDYDLRIEFPINYKEQPLTIEVKNDRRAKDTGNVAVELGRDLKDGWRDTCLSVTKADVYAYHINGTYYLMGTPILKKMVDEKKYSRLVKGGDANRATCALFKLDYFISKAEIVLKS